MIFKKFFNKDADQVQYFANKFNLSERIADLILSRGINTEDQFEEYLHPRTLHDPMLLKGMKELVDRVKLAKELKDRVLIFGDYDVDGVSATAIMLKTLKQFGIEANYYLPNRYIDGYGLTKKVIDKIADLFMPNLIITVDCGISCYDEIEYAKNIGIDVVVTDHHEIPDIIPKTIVVNAKLQDQKYPFRELCGTGVAFKFAQALLGDKKAEAFLPIAAIATIVDIVPLKDENRTIVTKGLKLCDKYLPIGLKMMFKENEISLLNPSATEISFKIGPKLNASGRMGDAGDSLKIYFETDPVKIRKDLVKIKNHNIKRQELCNRIYEDSEKQLENFDFSKLRVIALKSDHWDKGVLGIVCSRLVEKYHLPTFLFAEEGGYLYGSGRSIVDINIHQLLSSLQDILETYGGHSMAAGLTLKKENFQLFVQKINDFTINNVSDEVFIPIKYYDQEISEGEIDDDFIKQLSLLEPYGCENPKPKFKISATNIEIEPMKKFPQHANIKIGNLKLTYFNFVNSYNKIIFSRQKSFIFEFQPRSQRGIVDAFDGGSFIIEDAYIKLNTIEINQLVIDGRSGAKFMLYPKEELLSFVGATTTTVFGTCFVTYSCFDYVQFSKNYSTKNIYQFSIYSDSEVGYNSLLLSPKGINWAKNFSKIIFLSPVLDTKFISALNKISNAQIFIPIEKKPDLEKFSGIDLARNTFGKIFKAISSKESKSIYNVFDLYDSCITSIGNQISFSTFYSALLVFNQLKLINIKENAVLEIKVNKNIKSELTNSKIYKSLELLKETFKGDRNG